MYNRDKFSYDNISITFQVDNISNRQENSGESLRNYFQSRNKQKHYSLIVLVNPHILMKCNLIDIYDIILFQMGGNFPVTTPDLIFYWKHNGVRSSHWRCLQHRCFPVKLAKFLRTPFLNNICFLVQYGLLML